MTQITNIRNVAIIAHVDHGKTTMMDCLLKLSMKEMGAYRETNPLAERVLDSNDLERERGITILAKCAGLRWKDTRITMVDTPGHADFGGEVERILSMVDGVILLVDAAEGPMPQTKFVLGKALAQGLRPIVVLNKVDKPDARIDEVHEEVFDLFSALGANEEQLDFPMLFASGKEGWAATEQGVTGTDMGPVLDMIVSYVKPPKVVLDEPAGVLVTILNRDAYLGRLLTGRVQGGVIKTNMPIKILRIGKDGIVEQGRLSKILAFEGIDRVPVDSADPGMIITVAGLSQATVADTIADMARTEPLAADPIDPPTITMTFSVNDSPLAGLEGTKVTSRLIRDRLNREVEGNSALHIAESEDKDSFNVSGRGELQLSILIENMRREGFELSVSRPRVMFKNDPETNAKLEPYEEVVIDVDEGYGGNVVQKMTERKAELREMRPSGGGKQRLIFIAPSRGLIGYHGEFLTDTRGTGIMNRLFHSYGAYKGDIPGRRNGVLISNGAGEAVAYAMFNLEDRGYMMIHPQTKVYQGMIIGEHSRENDLEVNILRGKKLTNVRASGKDENVVLTPPVIMTLEKALAYVEEDELIEVTPQNIRLRKQYLDPNDRKRTGRAKEAAA